MRGDEVGYAYFGALYLVEKYSVGNAGRIPGLLSNDHQKKSRRRAEEESRYISVHKGMCPFGRRRRGCIIRVTW